MVARGTSRRCEEETNYLIYSQFIDRTPNQISTRTVCLALCICQISIIIYYDSQRGASKGFWRQCSLACVLNENIRSPACFWKISFFFWLLHKLMWQTSSFRSHVSERRHGCHKHNKLSWLNERTKLCAFFFLHRLRCFGVVAQFCSTN